MRNLSQKEIATPAKSYAKDQKLRFTTKQITYTATLVTITIMLKMIGNVFMIGQNLKISFTYVGWILSAVILGPFGGAAVGMITDVMGMLLTPGGSSINPVLTLGYTLFPFIIGMFYKYLPIKNKNISLSIGVAVSTIICTLGICSAGLYFFFGIGNSMPFFTYILTMRMWQVPTVCVNLVIALLFLPVIKRLHIADNP